jgi:hypothetical protein
VIFIPRFTAMALGILLRPSGPGSPDGNAGPAPVARFDAADAVFVGTVLDVWTLGDRRVARFLVERAAQGVRDGEIVGVVRRAAAGACPGPGAGERWMIVADRWLEPA